MQWIAAAAVGEDVAGDADHLALGQGGPDGGEGGIAFGPVDDGHDGGPVGQVQVQGRDHRTTGRR